MFLDIRRGILKATNKQFRKDNNTQQKNKGQNHR